MASAPSPLFQPGGCGDCVFLPETRCCTYQPNLPNFLVGRILADGAPGTAATRYVAGRASTALEALPTGICSELAFRARYSAATAAVFGRAAALRCPYHADDGTCDLHDHRASICATWFCKYQRGEVGKAFWHAMEELLFHVEHELAYWCVRQVGLDEGALDELVFTELKIPVDPPDLPEQRAARWGDWAGREQEFYVRCARLVEDLPWSRVLEIGGARALLLADAVQRRFRELMDRRLPATMCAGTFQVVEVRDDTVRLLAYSRYDPLDVPKEVVSLLLALPPSFTVGDLRAAATLADLALDDETVQLLLDHGVLRADAERRSPTPRHRSDFASSRTR